jgi:hypothetical protein
VSLPRTRTTTTTGLIDILDLYEVRTIVDSGFPKDLKTAKGNVSEFGGFRARALKEQVGNQRSRLIELRQTTERTLPCGTLDADIIHADAADLKGMGSGNTRQNNASTVIRLRFGAFRFLFMGDAEGKERGQPATEAHYVEKLLVDRAKKDPDLLRADSRVDAPEGHRTHLLSDGRLAEEPGEK